MAFPKSDVDLEAEFKFYITKMGLDESKMTVIQKQETKRAFYGGVAQLFIIFKEKVLNGTDGDLELTVSAVRDQVTNFFETEVAKMQSEQN